MHLLSNTEPLSRRISTMCGCAMRLIAMLVLGALPAHAANWQNAAEVAQLASAQQPGMAATASTGSYFQITKQDVAEAVAKQMQQQGLHKQAAATLDAGIPSVLYGANHPLSLRIHALQVDTQAQRWQAQAYIMNASATEVVKPIAGRFDATLNVPVLSRQLRDGDVIEAHDLVIRTVPERQLRKDAITDRAQLIGKSPLRIISAGRPIRLAEVSAPKVITKGQVVEMYYTTPHMSIHTTGEALEDGAPGQLIRIKNSTSDKAISARVVAAGKVEVNSARTL